MKRITFGKRFPWPLGCLLASFILVFTAEAGSEVSGGSTAEPSSKEIPLQKSSCEAPKSFEIKVGLPMWISRVEGGLGVRNVTSDLDITFSDILNKLDVLPIVLSAEARHDRWEFLFDGEYVKVSDEATLPGLLFTNADADLKFALWEGFLGYRLLNCEKATLSLYAGARYNYYAADFQIFDNGDPRFPILRERLGIPDNLRLSDSIDWVDPVVGLSTRIKIWRPVTFWAKADAGGFGANSDFTWQAQGGLEFQMTRWLWSQAGWRYLKNDFTSGGFTDKTSMNGPFLQVGANF